MNDEKLEKLIILNKKLIYKIASKYSKNNDIEDLFQVGAIGLQKAYKNYDENKSTKLMTYAYPYIRGEMKKYDRENKTIKVSRDTFYLNKKIKAVKGILMQELMREPTTYELSLYLKVDEEKIINTLECSSSVISLDKKNKNTSDDTNWYDVIKGENKDVDKLIDLRDSLRNLNDDEKKIIESRYMKDMNQKETGKVVGMSQVKAFREEKKILKKLYKEVA